MAGSISGPQRRCRPLANAAQYNAHCEFFECVRSARRHRHGIATLQHTVAAHSGGNGLLNDVWKLLGVCVQRAPSPNDSDGYWPGILITHVRPEDHIGTQAHITSHRIDQTIRNQRNLKREIWTAKPDIRRPHAHTENPISRNASRIWR